MANLEDSPLVQKIIVKLSERLGKDFVDAWLQQLKGPVEKAEPDHSVPGSGDDPIDRIHDRHDREQDEQDESLPWVKINHKQFRAIMHDLAQRRWPPTNIYITLFEGGWINVSYDYDYSGYDLDAEGKCLGV